MKRQKHVLRLVLLCITLFSGAIYAQSKTASDLDTITVYDFDAIEPLLYTDSDTIHIVNFWAMWCAPCVKELPILKAYEEKHPNVNVLLVSMDFPENIESDLKPFLKEKGITSKVVMLDDPDANTWIDKIDPNWSGAIPFTIIFNKDKRTFHERAFKNLEDLEQEIHNTLNN
ncbi:TlpA family protein disulfide reductase [Formosa algae]|uniref:Thiol-disulfide isomerase/thioredoxin n=1 Tax=Formosa algae TaxID=225843 RepID=A0A9X0YLA0_9FLAO|nr:TlpA family protein disulfide reductase [Formosa algae]MBP1840640.1 thiol-disulfide isomerase/thioredoxin [Formosa algae]MDQ0335947.1 thiol-disulfide isomerase/thioredoxin [Formosa algae]OEI81159.1 thioredoxin [Formosa algae]